MWSPGPTGMGPLKLVGVCGSRHTQGQPAFVKQGSEAYLVVKSEAVKQEKERI